MKVKEVWEKFYEAIDWIDKNKYELDIVTDKSCFSRAARKMEFGDIIFSVTGLKSGKMNNEILDYYECSLKTISAAGYYEARIKVKPEAFYILLKKINKIFHCKKKLKGYRLVSVDGTDLVIYTDKNDYETFSPCKKDSKGCNMLHANCFYDVLNNRFIDVNVQTLRGKNETGALIEMIKRYDEDEETIFVADRGYESYNVMEWIRNSGHKFVIRMKDITSRGCISRRFVHLLPETEEFDKEVTVYLTKKHNKETKNNPDKYIIIDKDVKLDSLTDENPYYEVTYRIVRFKISDRNYETIFTNLSKDEFSMQDIKDIYHARWGIETSFRYLKYDIGLNALHSKKRELVLQEIYAKLVKYNLFTIITTIAEKHMKQKKERKYGYKINLSVSFHIIQKWFTKRKRGFPPGILTLIAKAITPIKESRTFIRSVRSHSFISFNYRFSH